MIYCPALRIWTPPRIGPVGIEPSPPARTRACRMREWLRDALTYRGRLPMMVREQPSLINGGLVSRGHAMVNAGIIRVGGASNPLASLTDARAYWKFEDTSDSSGNSNTLTAVGGPTLNTGLLGNAAYTTQNGATKKYYTAADSTSLHFGAGVSFTLSIWAYKAGSDVYCVFTNRGTSAADDPWFIWDQPNVSTQWGTTGGASDGLSSTQAFGTGAWHWICLTVDPGASADGHRAYLYYDNSQIGIRNTGTIAAVGDGSATTYIGDRADHNPFSTAGEVRIDSFGLWARVITSDERGLLFNSGNGADPW